MKLIDSEVAIQLTYLVAGAETKMKLFNVTERLIGRNNAHALTDGHGHVGMVNDLLPYAELVAAYIAIRVGKQDFPGVFEYEVTEELGEWLANAAEASALTEATFKAQLEIVGDKFFSQSAEYNQEKSCASI